MAQSHKPLIWTLFAAGGVISAFVFPVLIFITGLAIPFGWVPSEVLNYTRVYRFASSWWGAMGLYLLLFFTIWHACHRFYFTVNDLGLRILKPLVKFVCYAPGWLVTIGLPFIYFKVIF